MVMNTVNFIKQSFDSGVHTVLRNVDIQCWPYLQAFITSYVTLCSSWG
jgi:hypothetical protein